MNENLPDPEAGYTLLETLVAFVILSMSVTAFFQAWSLSTNSIIRATERRETASAAASLLDRIGTPDIPLQPGDYGSNEAERPYWQVHIEPYEAGGAGPTRLFMVHIRLAPQQGSNAVVEIDTLRAPVGK